MAEGRQGKARSGRVSGARPAKFRLSEVGDLWIRAERLGAVGPAWSCLGAAREPKVTKTQGWVPVHA
jgi:hypothetical protein